ncbi:hypothetical protein GCM10023329_56170 [Streptomyces sanyensis]|uniref:Uncharacterized protein n=1 Tax=Streptomyces sanyensis TaxID=568869 RepID=A0ABP9BMH9_9ACTN
MTSPQSASRVNTAAIRTARLRHSSAARRRADRCAHAPGTGGAPSGAYGGTAGGGGKAGGEGSGGVADTRRP